MLLEIVCLALGGMGMDWWKQRGEFMVLILLACRDLQASNYISNVKPACGAAMKIVKIGLIQRIFFRGSFEPHAMLIAPLSGMKRAL